jgi:hypothetical protein
MAAGTILPTITGGEVAEDKDRSTDVNVNTTVDVGGAMHYEHLLTARTMAGTTLIMGCLVMEDKSL